jgi:hypothetical protein
VFDRPDEALKERRERTMIRSTTDAARRVPPHGGKKDKTTNKHTSVAAGILRDRFGKRLILNMNSSAVYAYWVWIQ